MLQLVDLFPIWVEYVGAAVVGQTVLLHNLQEEMELRCEQLTG